MLSPYNEEGPSVLYASMEMPTGHKCSSGWFELKAKGKLPDKRSFHSAVIYDGKLYVFGGEDIKEGRVDDLWCLDLDAFFDKEEKELEDNELEDQSELDKYCWHKIETHGDHPGKIAHHKACIESQCMYVFGGIDDAGDNIKHFYCLDMNSFKWSKYDTEGDVPEPRDDHSLCKVGEKVYLFGGFVNGIRRNDLYEYEFGSNRWTQLFENHPFDDQHPNQPWPCPRSGQAIGAANGRVYVFGGRNDYNDMLDDTWEFDSATKKWTQIEGENHPIGRSSHSLTIEGDRMILFGGIVDITKEINELHQFNFTERDWSGVDDDIPHRDGIDKSPSPRKRMRQSDALDMNSTQKTDDKKQTKKDNKDEDP